MAGRMLERSVLSCGPWVDKVTLLQLSWGDRTEVLDEIPGCLVV